MAYMAAISVNMAAAPPKSNMRPATNGIHAPAIVPSARMNDVPKARTRVG